MIRSMFAALGADWLDLAALVAIAAAALVYWWARKSAKHPAYAAKVEARVIDPALRKAGLDDLAAQDLVVTGQALYAQSGKLADELEAQAGRLAAHAKVLRQQIQQKL